jgi:exosortase
MPSVVRCSAFAFGIPITSMSMRAPLPLSVPPSLSLRRTSERPPRRIRPSANWALGVEPSPLQNSITPPSPAARDLLPLLLLSIFSLPLIRPLNTTTPISAASSPTHPTARSAFFSDARPLTSGLFIALLWFVLCRYLSSEWSLNEQYSYGWFVPAFAAILFWLRFEDRPQPPALSEAPSSKLQTPGVRDQMSEVSDRASRMEPTTDERHQSRNPRGEAERAETSESIQNRRGFIAAAVAIFALLLLLPLRVFEIGNPDWRPLGWIHAAVVVTVTLLVVWSYGGSRRVRHFAFPIAFIFVAVPWISGIEQPIVQGLMRFVAAVATEALTLFGIPARLEGNLIRIPNGLVGVNEACSGVRSLQTALMIGLLFGELKRFDLSRRILLIVSAVAFSLVANCGRAFFLVWIAATKGLTATNQWHDAAGYAIVVLVFIGTMGLAALLARGAHRKPRSDVRSQMSEVTGQKSGVRSADGQIRRSENRLSDVSVSATSPLPAPRSLLVAALIWLVFVELAAAGWYRVHERNLVTQPNWTVRWNQPTSAFREIKIAEGVRTTLRFDDGREVAWQTNDSTTGTVSNYLFFFRWNPGSSSVVRARAHRPDICLPSAGWQQLEDRGIKNYPATAGIALPARHISFRQPDGRAIAHTFFCLQEDEARRDEPRPDLALEQGVQPDWGLRGRTEVVKNGVRNLGQQVFEVVILSPVPMPNDAAEEDFGRIVREIIVAR